MNNTILLQPRLLTLLIAAALCGGAAFAQKPEHAGGPKNKHESKQEKKQEKKEKKAAKENVEVKQGAYFDDRHRSSVQTYYAKQGSGGKACPPGLAKKNNGCMPPGQAKKWNVGQPLPKDVVVYSVPQQVIVHLPPQPPGYKYVRVASDILLIAVGTQMVVDGINGLMR
jgi:Ni/Co efflux regulator RcnB